MEVDEHALALLLERMQNPPESRDKAWLNETAALLYRAPMRITEQQTIYGPDGHVYFALYPPVPGQQQPQATVEAIFDHVVDNAIGVVMLDPLGSPFHAFSHGDMLAWKIYGKPYPPRFWNAPEEEKGSARVEESESLRVGYPNEEMLPLLVRRSLRKAMTEVLRIQEPKAGVVLRPGEGQFTHVVLGLDGESLGGDERAKQAFFFLAWFMPSCIPFWHFEGMGVKPWMVPL